MRTEAPVPLTITLHGPNGSYSLRFVPDANGLEGCLMVNTGGDWRVFGSVEKLERRATGELVLSGLGGLSEHKTYWYELVAEPAPPCITYWGDRVIHRTDTGDVT